MRVRPDAAFGLSVTLRTFSREREKGLPRPMLEGLPPNNAAYR